MGIFSFFTKKNTDNSEMQREVFNAVMQYLNNSVIPITDNQNSYITAGFNKNIFVNMCVSYITRRASDIPWKLCKMDANGNEIEINRHPLIDLLDNPNPLQDQKELIEQALGYYLLTGNIFQWMLTPIAGTNKNQPKELWNLPSHYMEIVAGKDMARPITGYKLNTITEAKYAPEEILHVKSPNYDWDNGQWLYGASPLKAALSTINLGNSTVEAMTKQAQNSGALGLLMYDKQGNDNNITPEQLQQLKTKINTDIHGAKNRGKIVAASQMFKWQQLGMSAADMQLMEDHHITRDDICAIYGLASVLFNDHSSSTFNNIQEAKKSAYTDAIIPVLENYISKFNKSVVSKVDKDIYFKADYSGVRELQKDYSALIQSLQNAYWIPTSKKQELTGIEPDGELPEYLMPMNLIEQGEDIGADSERVEESAKRYKDG